MNHHATKIFASLFLPVLLLFPGAASLRAQVGVSPAQGGFILSTHEDFSTDDRLFGREDILYMRIDAPAIDFLGLEVNEFHLAPAGDPNADGMHGAFENAFDGTYTAKLDLSEAPSDAVAWTWSAHLEDNLGNEFKAEADIFIGDAGAGIEIEVTGVVEEVGEGFFVLYGRKVLVVDATEIVTEAGDVLRLVDLAAGDEVTAVISIETTTGGEVQLVALRVVRLETDRKEEVVVTGTIADLGDRAFVVQNLVFEVTEETRYLGPSDEPIGFGDLHEGQLVTVIGQYTPDGSLHAILVIVQGDDRGEFTLEGVLGQIVDGGIIVQETLFLLTEHTLVISPEGDVVSVEYLQPGQFVVVRAQLGENGLPIAISVNVVEHAGNEVFAKGAIEQLFDEGLVVQGRKFLVTANTHIVDENGQTISFSGLREGQVVTVIGQYTDAGELVALLITLGDDIQDEVEIEGVITAVGEGGIVVQDLFFAVTDATVIVNSHGEQIRYEQLTVGMFVQVTGTRAAEGMLYATKISIEPREIVVDGPIERIDESSFYVGGFHFLVTDETEIVTEDGQLLRFESLHVGAVVLVEGALASLADAAGLAEVYLAHRVVLVDDAREKIVITGIVHEVGDLRFVVGDYTFAIVEETVFKDEHGEPIDYAGIEPGMVVEVTALVGEGDVLAALCVQRKIRHQDKISGKIEAIEGELVVIAGVEFIVDERTEIFSVAGRKLEPANLEVGMLARALLTKLDSGRLLATHMQVLVRIEDEVWATGVVEAVLENSIVILGRTFYVTPHTVVVDAAGAEGRLEDIPVGRTVRVRADLLPGDGLVALHMTLLDEQVKDIHVIGPVESVEANTIAVMGIYFFTGADTRMFDVDGAALGLDAFRVGQTVELFAVGQADGTRLATLIRARDVVVAAGAITRVSDTEIEVLGRTYRIDGGALVLGAENDPILRNDLSAGLFAEIRGITTNDAAKFDAPSTVTKVKVLGTAEGTSIAVEDPVSTRLQRFILHQNYPNPFNPVTTIQFTLNEAGPLTLTVYTLLGQEVTTLVRGNLPAGVHRVEWDGSDPSGNAVASGVYLYRLQAGHDVQTRRMVLLK